MIKDGLTPVNGMLVRERPSILVLPVKRTDSKNRQANHRKIMLGSSKEKTMGGDNRLEHWVDPDGKWLYQVGGVSALLLGLGYLITIPLYAAVGAAPSGAETRLIYLAENTAGWWTIFGLMVFTDFLFIPVGLSLYLALKGINRNVMLLATAWVGFFIALDVAVTWGNYAALIMLSGNYTAAASEAERAIVVAAANYPAALLDSILASICAIFTLSTGILLTGWVMLKGVFNKVTAYLGLLTGASGIIAVFGPLFFKPLDVFTYVNAISATAWVFFVGFRLIRLARQ